MPEYMTVKQMVNRAILLKNWLEKSKEFLELKNRTIEIAIRLFDCYCHLKHQQNEKKGERKSKCGRVEHILDNQNEGKLTVLACFFSAAKF